jgi:diguanylate cyclase (GGDEF)-like protein/PAS domain S-box-containing protein
VPPLRPISLREDLPQLTERFYDAAICIDSTQTILYGNAGAGTLLGYTVKELQGLPLRKLLPNFESCTAFNSVQANLALPVPPSGKWADATVQLCHKSGQCIPAVVGVYLLGDPSQDERLHIAILKNASSHAPSQGDTGSSRFEYLFHNINDAVFLAPIDVNGLHGNFVEVNDVACERLGYTRQELLQLNARTLNPQANLNKVKSFGREIRREGKTIFESLHVAKDGTQIPVEVVAKVVTINDSDFVLSIVRDLREYKQLAKSEERFGKLMEHSWHEIYIFDSGSLQFLQVNQGAMDNLGYSKKELLQLTVTDIKPDIDTTEFRTLAEPLFDGTKALVIFETRHQRRNGTTYPVEIRLQLSHNETPPVFLAIVQDITDRKIAEERLTFLANYDPLTGLPNRGLFMDRLTIAMENCKRTTLSMALIFLDLDDFKSINDSLGHAAGDTVLQEVGRRLSECVRKSDTVARLGGDEFTILLTNIQDTEHIDATANKLLNHLQRPLTLADTEIQLNASLGITLFPLHLADDASTLLKQADTAMYHAKSSGKHNFKYFSPALENDNLKRFGMENALRKALEQGEFFLHYQPRIVLDGGRVAGAEALLRWRNVKFGLVSPLDFIPILERTGMIREIGYWVLTQCAQQLRRWLDAGLNLSISINVSARQMEEGLFPDQVAQALQMYAVPATHIEIEITEGLLMANSIVARRSLEQLRSIGVKIALDDFGTGYSSLTYLQQFPIDALKIDRSFIMDMATNPESRAIVDAIIILAHSLGLRVTAEGIEDETQIALLRQRNCDEGQGYLLSHPIPANEFELYYQARHHQQ